MPGSIEEPRGKLKGRDGSGMENGRKVGEPSKRGNRLARPGKRVTGKD